MSILFYSSLFGSADSSAKPQKKYLKKDPNSSAFIDLKVPFKNSLGNIEKGQNATSPQSLA